MQRVNHPEGKRQNVVFFLVALLIVGADQLSKIWIRSNLAIWQSLPETGFFRLTHIHNTGIAFGLFQGHSLALTVLAGVVIVALLSYVFFLSRYFPFLADVLGKSAPGLVLGGAIGNLIDRLRFGYVTDFIAVGTWPTFNIADSAVTVGAIVIAYSLFSRTRAGKQ